MDREGSFNCLTLIPYTLSISLLSPFCCDIGTTVVNKGKHKTYSTGYTTTLISIDKTSGVRWVDHTNLSLLCYHIGTSNTDT